MMKTNKNYRPPMILQEVSVQLERDFLENSLVDKAVIQSMGQDVENHDFGDETMFNHQWE